jgi:hypothetical protein
MDPALLSLAGAPASKNFKKVPMTTNVWFSGLVTQRSPFGSLDNRANRIYLHGRPDQLADGLNVELTNQGTYIRRPGTSSFNPNGFVGTIDGFYSFHQLNGNISVLVDSVGAPPPNVGFVWDISTPTPTPLFGKSSGAGQTFFQGVGNTLYMGDGADQFAWDGVNLTPFNAVRNWGIVAPSPSGSSSGYAGIATGSSWTTPANLQGAPDAAYASYNISIPPFSGFINGAPISTTNYGLSVPTTSAITGVQVNLTGYFNGSALNSAPISAVLLFNGSPIGNAINSAITGGPPETNLTFGGPSTTWEASLNSAIINSGTFGVEFYARGANNTNVTKNALYFLDASQIIVYESGSPIATVSSSTGTFSAVNGGYQYAYAYGNSASGHVSNPTLASNVTGNFTNKLNVSLPVVASTDPQVNQIRVYRTKDGGSVFYELPTSPYINVTTTITDNAADATLNTLVFWPSLPYVSNAPPPSGLVNLAYHLGRVWGSVGNFVYYSAGPDILIGNGNEAFPPANFFLFPSTVYRLVPYSSGLLVFTSDDVYIILGTSIATFYAMPFQQGVGLLSYNALDIQGSNIYLFTSDRQFLQLSSSGINEIGYAIGDQLALFDPTKVHVASIIQGTAEKAVYISDGSQTWFRCNWNQPPEGGPAWSPKAVIGGGCNALTSVETSPGIHQLLMSYVVGTNSAILFRDVTINTDAVTGSPYSDCFLTLGSLVLALPGQLAEVDSIVLELMNVGSVPSVSILTDEISGSFESLPNFTNDPPNLVPSTTVMSNRWYLAQGPNAARMRHMQTKIDFNQDTVRNELLTFSVFGGLIHEM